MREDNWLAVQPRHFVVTTKSDHKLEVYLNLARRHAADGNGSTLGCRHHLHSTENRVCLFSSDPRRIFSQGGGLVAGGQSIQPLGDGRVAPLPLVKNGQDTVSLPLAVPFLQSVPFSTVSSLGFTPSPRSVPSAAA